MNEVLLAGPEEGLFQTQAITKVQLVYIVRGQQFCKYFNLFSSGKSNRFTLFYMSNRVLELNENLQSIVGLVCVK